MLDELDKVGFTANLQELLLAQLDSDETSDSCSPPSQVGSIWHARTETIADTRARKHAHMQSTCSYVDRPKCPQLAADMYTDEHCRSLC